MRVLDNQRPAQQAVAPWKEAFLADITAMEGQEFALSTLHQMETTLEPRARFCAFRSFWAELPENPSNPAPRNEPIYTSDMPAFTTDARTGKVQDLSQAGKYEYEEHSGGGGKCEAVWWARDSLRQWRVRGKAYVIAPDIEGDRDGARLVKKALACRMHSKPKELQRSWSWTRELTAHLGSLTPVMRGRFVAPPPGQSVDVPWDDKNLGVGKEIYDLQDPTTRKHFRVVVIVPEEVEVLQMGDPHTARRHIYTFDCQGGVWTYRECWP